MSLSFFFLFFYFSCNLLSVASLLNGHPFILSVDVKEQAATKANCCIALHGLCLGQKVALGHITKTSADGQLAPADVEMNLKKGNSGLPKSSNPNLTDFHTTSN